MGRNESPPEAHVDGEDVAREPERWWACTQATRTGEKVDVIGAGRQVDRHAAVQVA